MYINTPKLATSSFTGTIQMIIGGFIAFFFTFGLVAGITGYSEELRKDIPLAIVCDLFAIPFLYAYFSKKQMRKRANRLNQLFISDADGIIPAEQLVPVLDAKSTGHAVKMMEKLISKKYMINCNVDYSDGVKVILYRAQKKDGSATDIYEAVVCSNCGAEGKRRKGYIYTCPYCGTEIE